MNGVGWLLDPYVDGKYAYMWVKDLNGQIVRLRERYSPTFIVEPAESYPSDNIVYLFEVHPFVIKAKVVSRFSTISRKECIEAVEVFVDTGDDLNEVLKYAESLLEVKEVYNSGLIPIQWYLIHRDLPPSCLCDFEERKGFIEEIMKLDDEYEIEPPPLDVLGFRVPEYGEVNEVDLLDSGLKHIDTIFGPESKTLSKHYDTILNSSRCIGD